MSGYQPPDAGEIFGRLTFIELFKANGLIMWRCKCRCGNTTVAYGSNIRKGATRSCGCRRSEASSERRRTHGLSKTRAYRIWRGINRRCYDTSCKEFSFYGARGVRVCDEWRSSFQSFMDDMGNPPSDQYSIDRLNVDGDYTSMNCRWATAIEQANNKRNNRRLTYQGETKTVAEWERSLGVPKESIRQRVVKLGWSAEKAISTPIRKKA